MTQYAMKEAMRLVEPDPAESKVIRRALFVGSYAAIQLSTFEQRATSCKLHQDQKLKNKSRLTKPMSSLAIQLQIKLMD